MLSDCDQMCDWFGLVVAVSFYILQRCRPLMWTIAIVDRIVNMSGKNSLGFFWQIFMGPHRPLGNRLGGPRKV